MLAEACRHHSQAGTPCLGRACGRCRSIQAVAWPAFSGVFIAGSTRFLDGSTVICIESSNRPATHADWGKGNRETVRYDSAVLERVAQRFRRDMWDSVVPEAISESGVEVERFGPVQATAFGDLPEVHMLQQIQGAAEPGAIEGGYLAAAVEWMRAREVDYRIPVAAGRPGAPDAEGWLGARGYERGAGWVKMVRDGSPPDFEIDPGITLYRLGADEAEGEGLSTIAAEALEMPLVAGTLFFSLPQRAGWHCYTASLGPDEIPVATGSRSWGQGRRSSTRAGSAATGHCCTGGCSMRIAPAVIPSSSSSAAAVP